MGSPSNSQVDELDILRGVETVITTIKAERDTEKLLSEICGKVLEIFGCDRSWLLFPCDPDATSWSVPIERAVPAFPGASSSEMAVSMTPDVAEIFRTALQSESPVVYGPGGLPLAENTKGFDVRSQLSMAIYPRVGPPWQFGLHQCSHDREWQDTEVKLFRIIGVMTAEALGNTLLVRDLEAANRKLEQRVRDRTAELEAEKDFAESLVATAQAIVLLLDTSGRIVRFNPYMEEITGYTLAEVQGKDWFETFLPEPERPRIRRVFRRAVNDVHVRGNVNTITTRDGRARLIEWYSKTLKGPGGAVVGLLAVGHDVTRRVESERKIRASLAEKDVLLQEIHHRVKNNMQVVSSLIGIQRTRLKDLVDPEMLAAFRETENRINSMALVHERLYRSADFAHVEFNTYIQQLAEDLFRTYRVRGDTVVLDTRIQTVEISINQAIPCGLIVNELVSNALKHAFPDGRPGRIIVTLGCDSPGIYDLSVCDDGLGLPHGFDAANAKTTGLAIVNALVRQLDADMNVQPGDPTCFHVRFRLHRRGDAA
jgi:PAS domain S-box-containing protein